MLVQLLRLILNGISPLTLAALDALSWVQIVLPHRYSPLAVLANHSLVGALLVQPISPPYSIPSSRSHHIRAIRSAVPLKRLLKEHRVAHLVLGGGLLLPRQSVFKLELQHRAPG